MSEEHIKKYKWLTLVVLVLVVIPMLLVAIYSRPFADDFGYSARAHAVWASSHNILALLSAIGAEVKEVYYSWQGSFSALALFSLQPSIFGDKLYGLSTVILVGFFLWGNWFFWKKVMGKCQEAVIVFAAVTVLCTQVLPHAFQGFYWWNGASYYTLFYSLMLIQWGMLLEKKRVVVPCILGFLLGGGNLVSGLLGLEVTALFLLVEIVDAVKGRGEGKTADAKSVVRIAAIFIFSLVGFIINVIAPGNAIRAQSQPYTQGPLEAIGNSFLEAYRYMNEWVDEPLIVMTLFLLPFLWHYAGKRPFNFGKIPFFAYMALGFGLLASTFTPTLYSMCEVGPRRVQNIRFFFFVILVVLVELEAVRRIRALTDVKVKSGQKLLRGYMLVLLLGILIFLGDNALPKDNRYNVTSIEAARSFLIGESGKYARERDEWAKVLESDEPVVTVHALHDHPVPIYYSEFDITGDPEDYRDQSMCEYYGKQQIIYVQD